MLAYHYSFVARPRFIVLCPASDSINLSSARAKGEGRWSGFIGVIPEARERERTPPGYYMHGWQRGVWGGKMMVWLCERGVDGVC